MSWSNNKNGVNGRGNAMPSNNFQLPLINSHWKMLPFMTSFPHSEKVNNILRNAFHLPPYHCFLFICLQTCQEHLDTKGGHWTWCCCSVLHPGPTQYAFPSCAPHTTGTSVFNRAQEPLNPLVRFSWNSFLETLYQGCFQDLWCRQNPDTFLCICFLT